MKKATFVFFVLTAVFICILTGILIGRNSASGMFVISGGAVSANGQTVTNAATEENSVAVTDTQSGKININTASVSLLQTLPNIGEVLAQRIVDYRNENGEYTVVEDLLLVEGIGQKRLDDIRNYITVGG